MRKELRFSGALVVVCVLGSAPGCVSVRAPERINIGSNRPEPVDSRRIPPTSSHEQARQELNKAYANIQHLESENQRLERKAAEYRQERDDCKEGRGGSRDNDD